MTITERIDAVTHIPDSHRAAVIPPPKSVKIELTARCNFRCHFCARSLNLRDQGDMDPALYARLCREMADAGVEELGVFYLGESTMLPWLASAIRTAKQHFPYVFLTTNGSVLTPQKAREYFQAGLDSLKFSLNYADAEQFGDIAQVSKKYFDRILFNIVDARCERDHVERETGHRCGLYASYIAYDGAQGERMKEVIAKVERHVDEVYALPLYGQAGPQSSPIKKPGMRPVGGNPGRLDNPRPPLPCWAVFMEGHITHDGKLSACCWDHNDGLTMADLTQVSFTEGWNSAAFQALRAAHLAEDVSATPCRHCVGYV